MEPCGTLIENSRGLDNMSSDFYSLNSIWEVVGEPGETVSWETKAVESTDKNAVIGRVEALVKSMNTAARYCLLSMEVMILFRTLSVAEVLPWPARKPDCIAEKVRWDSKCSVICFVNLAFEDFRKAG